MLATRHKLEYARPPEGVLMRRFLVAASVLAAAALVAAALFAQGRTPGTVDGQVLDANGKAVAGARVYLQVSDGSRPHIAKTDATGRFRFPPLRPGNYDVRAQSKGRFSDWAHNVLLRAGGETTITLRLTLTQPPGAQAAAQAELAGRIREWSIPVENSLPHDPAVDPQGMIWLTLQRANQVARLNPDSGEWKFFTALTPNSGPHGLVSDADGNIWFTENNAGKIGRVDARSGAVTEYATPAKDPHTPMFAPDGALYFTAQVANLLVRMDTKTGATREFPVPTANARPYGLVLGPDNALWFCEFGVNKLGRLDPKTGAISEYESPHADAHPRRLVVLGDAIYYSDFRGGRLGRFQIASKTFQEWPSPSGAQSEPYGIATDIAGNVWYEEFAANQLVRFTPQTQAFRRYPMPSPRSEVRHMVRDFRGRIWMALSGANKVAMVE